MEQTTQYLYEYQNGKRVRNIGFMKIEKQLDKYIMQIYAKNVDDIQGILFQKDNGEKYIGGWEAEMLPVEEEPTTEAMLQDMEENTPLLQKQPATSILLEQEEVDTYIPPQNITYEKLSRQDISRFPRKEWRIANNSFLLHGYHNYHHLLCIKEDEKIWQIDRCRFEVRRK